MMYGSGRPPMNYQPGPIPSSGQQRPPMNYQPDPMPDPRMQQMQRMQQMRQGNVLSMGQPMPQQQQINAFAMYGRR